MTVLALESPWGTLQTTGCQGEWRNLHVVQRPNELFPSKVHAFDFPRDRTPVCLVKAGEVVQMRD